TRTGKRRVELLPDEEERGLRTLPPPSEGDVWLDLEGHPFYEPARGLEYLFGWCYRDGSETRYEVVWGLDRVGEKAAFERFVDWVEARRRVHPDLHVYHYAGYERTALRRLMGEHSTREREIDEWLRTELLVDLYRVVKQSLRAGVTSYSIKEIEKLYGFVRTAEVGGGTNRASFSHSGSRRRTATCSRGSAPTTRRTPARRSRSTSGSSGSGRPGFPGSFRRSSGSGRRRRRSATRRGSPSTKRCSRPGRRAARPLASEA